MIITLIAAKMFLEKYDSLEDKTCEATLNNIIFSNNAESAYDKCEEALTTANLFYGGATFDSQAQKDEMLASVVSGVELNSDEAQAVRLIFLYEA